MKVMDKDEIYGGLSYPPPYLENLPFHRATYWTEDQLINSCVAFHLKKAQA